MLDSFMRPLRLAISYIRWSTPLQRLGDSKRRQLERTKKFCQEHNLVLDQTLIESGLSAFSGKHRAPGSVLRAFLDDLAAGKIPKGSVLVIESLDRLSREAIPEALELFLGIIRNGVDICTLIDGNWYTAQTIGEVQNLMISIICIWHAWEESRKKSYRVGEYWQHKRARAIDHNEPMMSICPGWVRLSSDGKHFEPIPERAKLVRVIFRLTLRGWGVRRIALAFNSHKIPSWGVGKKAANGWHHSYITKILHNRSVLGEFMPHVKKVVIDSNDKNQKAIRQAVGAALKNYYPRIISDAVFYKIQLKRPAPRGPLGRKIANLFQGLLKDGDFIEQKDGEVIEYSMVYKDHGDRWTYVVSDHKRLHPEEPIFSWQYQRLETLILNYLIKLDWSGLTVEMDGTVRQMTDDLAVAEGKVKQLDLEIERVIQFVKAGGASEDAVREQEKLQKERAVLRVRIQELRTSITSKRNFPVEEGAALMKKMAADKESLNSRLRLRNEIRRYVNKIELFRTVPATLTKGLKLPSPKPGVKLEELLHARCVRIEFANGAERWIVDHGGKPGFGLRFDGATLPYRKHIIVEKDEFGGKEIVDMRTSKSIRARPIQREEHAKKRAR